MSMSKAERKLPQYCYVHPRNDYRSFRPEEGRFIRNHTRFICHGCLEKQRRNRAVGAARRISPLESEAWNALAAAGYKFQCQYGLGRYHFDLALPRHRLLIELDGKRWHESRRARARDAYKKAFAESQGWQVVHIPNGPGLVKRLMDAIKGQGASGGAHSAAVRRHLAEQFELSIASEVIVSDEFGEHQPERHNENQRPEPAPANGTEIEADLEKAIFLIQPDRYEKVKEFRDRLSKMSRYLRNGNESQEWKAADQQLKQWEGWLREQEQTRRNTQ